MPNPNNKTKMTGDTHLPDVESELPLEDGSTGAVGADGTPSGRASQDGGQNQPGRGKQKAGIAQEGDEGRKGRQGQGKGVRGLTRRTVRSLISPEGGPGLSCR